MERHAKAPSREELAVFPDLLAKDDDRKQKPALIKETQEMP